MPVPLYQAKAELFRTLGHPTRVRVLELLQDGPKAVSELLTELNIEPSNLSQQLAVLRRAGIVVSTRQGTGVVYELAAPTSPTSCGQLGDSSRTCLLGRANFSPSCALPTCSMR